MNDITISASQVGTFRLCPRRWFYESVLKRRSPPSESMLAGTKLHALLENYLQHGTWPDGPQVVTLWNPARTVSRAVDLRALAQEGLAHLPPPGSNTVEGEFADTIDGINYTGFIDLHHRREGVLTLQDHKTSSDPTKYGLHEKADYLDDPQALLYARHLLKASPGDDVICLQWVYYRTKGKAKAVATAVLLTRAEIEAAFVSVVHRAASEMVQIRKKGVDAGLPRRNTDSCYAWHKPCEHMAYCKPLEEDTQDMSSFDDFFAEEAPAKAPEAPKGKDLLADLEAAPAPVKAPKAAKAKDPINPPEKPKGKGLEPQGIGRHEIDGNRPITCAPTPTAEVNALADVAKADNGKALLLSVADLLTKIANAI